jgi:DNA-binding LacI/PurR family transcriptional regulator
MTFSLIVLSRPFSPIRRQRVSRDTYPRVLADNERQARLALVHLYNQRRRRVLRITTSHP